MVCERPDEKDKKAIEIALVGLNLGTVIYEDWQEKLEKATASGWFNPCDPEEMALAIAALRQGKKVPSFPRSG